MVIITKKQHKSILEEKIETPRYVGRQICTVLLIFDLKGGQAWT